MERALAGCLILIVEDEPLIALDIAQAFEGAGAYVLKTRVLQDAVRLVERDGLSAAVLDHALGDGDGSHLCERLKERDIPFIMYSGFSEMKGACRDSPRVAKPANPAVLVNRLAGLLRGHAIPS